ALIFMEFDQRVDAEAVLRNTRVRAGAGDLRLRLAKDDEINADESLKALVKDAVKGRWLVLRALNEGGGTTDALPSDSSVTVTVGAGTPSAEGPRVTAAAQDFSFRTYGAFRVTNHQCGWNKTCTPFDQWRIDLSNPVDMEAFDQSQVKIEPETPGAKVAVYGQTIYVSGARRGRTTYKVTLDRNLRDTFGQTLQPPYSFNFNVGPAPPSLFGPGGNFVVLEPAGAPALSVYSVNQPSLKVSLYAVGPEDFERYVAYMKSAYGYYDARQKQKQTTPPGTLVLSKTIQPAGQPDELTETRIDLAPALRGGRGNVFVVVEPATRQRDREILRTWVQVTSIGLDAFADREELLGWATSLADGRPLEGVEMSLKGSTTQASTGADGLARLYLPPKSDVATGLLIARKGDEVAFLPERADWWGDQTGWVRHEAGESLRWYVFDDRKMYRPGEELSVKGWIRRVGEGKTGDVGALAGAATSVSYTVRDSRANEVLKGTARLNATGGFDLKLKLPATMNLGYSYIQFQAEGGAGVGTGRAFQHQFQVQEFRRPEFEVGAQSSEGPFFVGGHAQATVTASYYAGGGLPNSEVNWSVTATPSQYTPPNRGDYTFGKWTPWWESYNSYASRANDNTQTFKGTTDAAGKHVLRIDFDSVNPPRPTSVAAQASVTDVNRQTWTATTTMLVHPSDLYVG
ncbi:MAG: MG2 domain-containing protein, partial [Acidobacteriota bacterium]|nr:MG2 domain-containing protein [Acidobacteriota bacterium]